MFGNIQDAHVKQSAQLKNTLVANGAIEILISIIRCKDPSGPKFDYDQDIFQKGGPEWTAEFVLQTDATLAMRRLLEVGVFEAISGKKRVHQAVAAGVVEVLVPHLYCTSCAAQYAAGALKAISMYEEYRQGIIDADGLPALVTLMKGDLEVEKSSFRQTAECLHLLSCTTTDKFEEMGVLEACLEVSLNSKAGEKPVLLSVLCAANITAGQDDEAISTRMEEVYRQVQLGVHLCRWLNTSLDKDQKPYFTIKCSQVDMLRSVCLLAASDVGRLQLLSCFIKEDGSLKKLSLLDILLKFLMCSVQNDKRVDIIMEILLHFAFSEQGANLLRNSKNGMLHLRDMSETTTDVVSSEHCRSARNILSVLKGTLGVTQPDTAQLQPTANRRSSAPRAPAAPSVEKKMKKKEKKNTTVEVKVGNNEDNEYDNTKDTGSSNDNYDCNDDDDTGVDIADNSPLIQQKSSEDLQRTQLPHVMISYSWAHQEAIVEICRHLRLAEIPYWLDIEQMHGEINDRMAEAIESCGVVIVGVSSKYKLSANCRMEAEYSNTSGKTIIPLMMEKNYRANGWLGLLIAGKLYYDVSPEDENRENNIASVVDVVKAAIQREAAMMPSDCLLRSQALFNKNSSHAQAVVPVSSCVSTSLDVSENVEKQSGATQIVHKEGGGPLVQLNSSGGLSLDSVSLLIDQMQMKLQVSIAEQLSPVVKSLRSIEDRLDKIEGNLKKL